MLMILKNDILKIIFESAYKFKLAKLNNLYIYYYKIYNYSIIIEKLYIKSVNNCYFN